MDLAAANQETVEELPLPDDFPVGFIAEEFRTAVVKSDFELIEVYLATFEAKYRGRVIREYFAKYHEDLTETQVRLLFDFYPELLCNSVAKLFTFNLRGDLVRFMMTRGWKVSPAFADAVKSMVYDCLDSTKENELDKAKENIISVFQLLTDLQK